MRLGNFFLFSCLFFFKCHIASCHPDVLLNCIWMDGGIFFLLENVLWFPHCDLFKPWFRNMYVQFLYAFCVSYIIMGKSWGCWEDSWFRMSCSTLAIYSFSNYWDVLYQNNRRLFFLLNYNECAWHCDILVL